MKKITLLLLLASITWRLSAQHLPVIRANSELVDIRDGEEFMEKNWTIVPEYRPDVYTSNKIGQRLTFYTDTDSISFMVHPDSVYDFVILLNGKDSAFTQVQYAPTYLEMLRKAEAYDRNDQTPFPAFTYQDAADPNLQTLRRELNLDSIAGGGKESTRILNLMHWIHDLVPHDGNHENPVVRNALSMIRECKQDSRGLNCRGLAIVLNECYLALGIPSRFVTCMPKDSVFNDCHVINMVFASDLDKWIWIDPTHDAYVMDENGTLLGLEEVRKKLINGETIILNPGANWNHRESTVKEFYLEEYMAKNLYRMECPLRSEYNYETREKGKQVAYVELLPLDAYRQRPKSSEQTNENTGMTFKSYKTNNPDLFWVKPR